MTRQFICYVLIGLDLNAVLYWAYFFLTITGMGAFAAMSCGYRADVLMGFFLNREIAFDFRDGQTGAIFALPLLLFILQKYLGFASPTPAALASPARPVQ